jgi:hypothetical protein
MGLKSKESMVRQATSMAIKLGRCSAGDVFQGKLWITQGLGCRLHELLERWHLHYLKCERVFSDALE